MQGLPLFLGRAKDSSSPFLLGRYLRFLKSIPPALNEAGGGWVSGSGTGWLAGWLAGWHVYMLGELLAS